MFREGRRFPRLYAAASLKPDQRLHVELRVARFSAALCRGLIEAQDECDIRCASSMFSAALCRGLIEAIMARTRDQASVAVFRGFMPRPH